MYSKCENKYKVKNNKSSSSKIKFITFNLSANLLQVSTNGVSRFYDSIIEASFFEENSAAPKLCSRSFIYSMNNTGPKTEP